MNPLQVAALINAVAALIPAAMQLAADVKATASATDQSAVDAAIANLMAAAAPHLVQAEADLDAAAMGAPTS
jgi:hypothetical protein